MSLADYQSRLFQWPSPAKQIPDKQRENAHRLIDVLHRLVDEGHTVVVIEHPMAIAAEADWILDIGPKADDAGDEIVAQGPPEKIIVSKKSRAAPFLKAAL